MGEKAKGTQEKRLAKLEEALSHPDFVKKTLIQETGTDLGAGAAHKRAAHRLSNGVNQKPGKKTGRGPSIEGRIKEEFAACRR